MSGTYYDCSIQQETALFSQELAHSKPSRPTIFLSVLQVQGEIRPKLVSEVLEAIVRRHFSLMATFSLSSLISPPTHVAKVREYARTRYFDPGMYRQSVGDLGPVGVRTVDLSDFPDANRDSALAQVFSSELECPFDYGRPPFLRAVVVRLNSAQSLLLLDADRIAADEGSMRLLARESVGLYLNAIRGLPCMAKSVSQYSDYAQWQIAMFRAGAFDEALAFWWRQWRRFGSLRIASVHLPFVLEDGSKQTRRISSERILLDDDTVQLLASASSNNVQALQAIFVALVSVLIHAYTGRAIVPLWISFPNRNRPGISSLIGNLSTSHIIGVDVSVESVFSEMANRVAKS